MKILLLHAHPVETSFNAALHRLIVERLASELLSNPLMERYEVEALGEAPAPATVGLGGAHAGGINPGL